MSWNAVQMEISQQIQLDIRLGSGLLTFFCSHSFLLLNHHRNLCFNFFSLSIVYFIHFQNVLIKTVLKSTVKEVCVLTLYEEFSIPNLKRSILHWNIRIKSDVNQLLLNMRTAFFLRSRDFINAAWMRIQWLEMANRWASPRCVLPKQVWYPLIDRGGGNASLEPNWDNFFKITHFFINILLLNQIISINMDCPLPMFHKT